jgi:processive 1,2-diacylglycerol beta-glucosyltransferase
VASRRAVLLSGSLGLGHEMLVRSCASVLEDSGWEVTSLDCMRLLGRTFGSFGQGLFTRVVSAAPGLYDGFHFAHLRPGSPLACRMGESASARLVPALREAFSDQPPQLVLSVFATGASAAAALRRETAVDARTVVLCTDVTLHRLWVADGTDLFLATSPAAAASVLRYLPRARVSVIPAPVRPAFYDAPSQQKARAELGLPLEGPCVLVLDSVWDVGALEERVGALARAGIDVLAVAGRQRAVEERFRAIARRDPRVHPFGFVEDVPRLMAAADVVMAMPGATTCSEARVVGRPLMLLDAMPGHGRENLVHELELGNALVAGSRPADVVASVETLLERTARNGVRRGRPVARWEPPFVSALRSVGLDVGAHEHVRTGHEVRNGNVPPSSAGSRGSHKTSRQPAPTTGTADVDETRQMAAVLE